MISTPQALLPKAIEIETSTACNRRCSWCPNAYHPQPHPQHVMPMSGFAALVEELSDLSFNGDICLHGYNEPLLDPLLFERLALLRDRLPAVSAVLVTNGDELSVDIFERLIRVGVAMVRVAVYDDRKTINPALLAAKLECGAPLVLSRTRIGFELTTKRDEAQLVFVMRDPATFTNRGGSIPEIDGQATSTGRCTRPFSRCVLDVAGRLKVCCEVYSRSDEIGLSGVVGHVFDNGLLNTWLGNRMNAVRREMYNGKPGLAICARCTMPNWTTPDEIVPEWLPILE